MDRFEAPPGRAGAVVCALPASDTEEIEYEGHAYRIPAALKDAFLRQADYTRKTQELARDRQALARDRMAFEAGVEVVAKALGALLTWSANHLAANGAPDEDADLAASPGSSLQ